MRNISICSGVISPPCVQGDQSLDVIVGHVFETLLLEESSVLYAVYVFFIVLGGGGHGNGRNFGSEIGRVVLLGW